MSNFAKSVRLLESKRWPALQINPTKSLPSVEDWQALADAGDNWKVEEEEGSFSDGYPEGAPSLLSSKFLAVQGGKCIVLGATKRPGLTPQEAFQVRPLFTADMPSEMPAIPQDGPHCFGADFGFSEGLSLSASATKSTEC